MTAILLGGWRQPVEAASIPLDHDSSVPRATFTQDRLLLQNMKLNNEVTFITLPGLYSDNPPCLEMTDSYFWNVIVNQGIGMMGITLMRLHDVESDSYAFPLLSTRDATHPVILIPSRKTQMKVTLLPFCGQEPPEMGLAGLKVPTEEGKWINADEEKQAFYSYEHDWNHFSLTFPENDTHDYRAIMMTIGKVESGISPSGVRKKCVSGSRRTWLFVQLPEGNEDTAIESLPYKDFTVNQKKFSGKTSVSDMGKDGFALFPFFEEETLLQTLQLNDELAFLAVPPSTLSNPDDIYNNLVWLEKSDRPSLPTQMYLWCLDKSLEVPYLSSQDAEHPIMLVPSWRSQMEVRSLNDIDGKVIPMELASLKVPDGKGGWTNANRTERERISYHRRREFFVINFPENKTHDFKCIAMTIQTVKKYSVNGGPPAPISRTWLFIQLPWTDDPAIFNHIPYTDFTVDQLQ